MPWESTGGVESGENHSTYTRSVGGAGHELRKIECATDGGSQNTTLI
jgi:hypothetical protein